MQLPKPAPPPFLFLLLSLGYGLSGCTVVGPEDRQLLDLSNPEGQYIAAFEKQYGDYLVAEGKFPKGKFHTFDLTDTDISKALWKGGSKASLGLTLGDRHQVGDLYRFRSDSRYILDRPGGIKHSAESVFAREDLNNEGLLVSIGTGYDSISGKTLVYERLGWSVERLIVFPAEKGEPVRYFEIPSRMSSGSASTHEIIGFHDARVLVRQDGKVFAYPLDILKEESDLAFAIG